MTLGEVFLGAFLQVLVEKLASPALAAFLKLVGSRKTRKTIQQWERPLRSLHNVIADAEQKQFTNNAVKNWLHDLRDLAYDMEDVLELLDNEARAHAFNNNNNGSFHPGCLASAKKMVKRLPFLFKPNDQDIQSKVDDITRRLHNIDVQRCNLSLIMQQINPQQTLQTEGLRNQRETSSMVSESKLFGRDDMKEEIIKRLLLKDEGGQTNESFVMIPIVGTGGIGKTKLAQHVYNDERLKHQFDLMAWVCVSDVFDVKHIITKICKATPDSGSTGVDFSTLDEAQTRLKQVLMGKKFLIVLDDIWNENYDLWEKLQAPFVHAAEGSRVIMTTRNESIAKLMNTNSEHDNIINIGGLSDDACWNIVQQHANKKTALVEMRSEIIDKCKGLPLAAKVLGGVLKTKDSCECRQLLKSNLWTEDENSVLPVLRLSYYHLPSHLKRVFAYCSIFPKDFEFAGEEFVLLCMAQGFLPDNQSESMEKIGQNYLHELVRRSLLEVLPGSKKEFVMHDLIHDLALWAAGDICHVINTEDIMAVGKKRARHVFVSKDADTSLGSPSPMVSQLRTLACTNDCHKSLGIIQKLRCVRSLILRSDTVEVLPECIWDLKLLRLLFLEFRNMKELSKLINNLSNLHTLLLDCAKLEKVPNIGSLKKLRWLDLGDTPLGEMPRGIENLTNLQSVGGLFVLGDGQGSRVRELKNLNNLQGNLEISGLENVLNAEDAKEAQLHEKCGLDKLCLTWRTCEEQVYDGNTQGDVLEQLKPSTSIKKYKLDGYMGWKLPAWLGDPCFTNMVRIKLVGCKKCKELPPLGQLPGLERLEIQDMENIEQVGPGFYGELKCSYPFPALKHLDFYKMPSWKKWIPPMVENGRAFASLQVLHIDLCPELRIEKVKINEAVQEPWVPHCLPSLQELSLREVASEEDIGFPSSLHKILISDNPNLKNLSVVDSINLTELCITGCGNLETLVGNFTSLTDLHLSSCLKLQSLPQGIFNSLTHLHLSRLGSSTDAVERIPGPELDLLSSLSLLWITDFQNLVSVKCSALPNLDFLAIERCPKFESFGDDVLPAQLPPAQIADCELIRQHLKRDPNGRIRLGYGYFSLA